MIICNSLYKSFGESKALNGISFEICSGAFLGLLGPNGAGKTTLMRIMTGLLEPDIGNVTFDNIGICRDAVSLKSRIGVVSQHINLDKELSVEENMIFSGKLYKMDPTSIKERTKELLAFLDLEGSRGKLAKHLSGGMKRKLMIAKAIIHNPDYIFLDEPTVGVDASARRDIWTFLEKQHRDGKTIMLTTHYIEEAQRLCSDVMLMSDGNIFRQGSPECLIGELGPFKLESFAQGRHVLSFHRDAFDAKKSAEALAGEYAISATSLEDVFFNYTNKRVHTWK